MTKREPLRDYTMIYNSMIRSGKLDVYQKSCISNILSNEDDFKMSISSLAKRIPASKSKCIKVINALKELNIVSVSRTKTSNGDWDSNIYKINFEELLKYLEVVSNKDNVVSNKDNVVSNKDNVVSNKDNSSISQTLGVVLEKDNKNTNKNINKENIYNSNDYEEIWKTYPNKQGKAKSITYINKILKSITKEELLRCIDRYKKYVEEQRSNGFKTLAYKNGSTFFNTGYVDYLDENYGEDEIKEDNQYIEEITLDDFIGERV